MLDRFVACAQDERGFLGSFVCAEPGLWWLGLLVPLLSLGWNGARVLGAAWRWWRRLSAAATNRRWIEKARGHAFSIAGFSTDVRVEDFVPGEGYDPRGIGVRMVADPAPGPPEHLRDAYEAALAGWSDRLERGEIYEGPAKLAARRVRPTRSGGEERPGLQIDVGRSSYVHHRACSEVFRSALSADERERMLADPKLGGWASNSLGLLLAVVTGDRKLLFVPRSHATAVNGGKLVCSLAEALSEADIVEGRFSLRRAVERAMEEEIGVSPRTATDLAWSIHGALFNEPHFEWNLFGVVELSEAYGERELIEYFSGAKMKDKWESGGAPEFVQFREAPLAAYLARNAGRMTNYSLAVAIMAGMAKLDAGRFQAALRRERAAH